MSTLEYAAGGIIGMMVPRESTTVEPELSVLLGPDVTLLAMRMKRSGETQFDSMRGNGRAISAYAAEFGTAPIDVFGFGLTATSYLMPAAEVPSTVHHVGREIPVVLAAIAIRAALADLGAKRIGIVSPYWAELTAAALAHYSEHGIAVAEIVTIGPAKTGHDIYGLKGSEVAAGIKKVKAEGIDAIVITGTGAPSLAALSALQRPNSVPVLSSNFCLGWQLAVHLNRDAASTIHDWMSPDARWKQELARRYPSVLAAD